MPRAPKAIKRSPYRPKLDIDWDVVDDFLETGCPGTKIADAIGVHHETLYNRCEQEKGMAFSAYSQTKKNKGDALLLKAQFDKAIGRTELGDSSLLTHLGKTRLEQRETTEIAVAPETAKSFLNVMEQLSDLQQKNKEKIAQAQEPNDTIKALDQIMEDIQDGIANK